MRNVLLLQFLTLFATIFIVGCRSEFNSKKNGLASETSNVSISATVNTKLIYSEKNTSAWALQQNILPIVDVSSVAAAPPALTPPSVTPTYATLPITYHHYNSTSSSSVTTNTKSKVDATTDRPFTVSISSTWDSSIALADKSCKIFSGYASTVCSSLTSLNLQTQSLLTGFFSIGAYIKNLLGGQSTNLTSEHYLHKIITDLNSGDTDSIREMTKYHGKMYFTGLVSGNRKLLRTDGTIIEQILDNQPGLSDEPQYLKIFNNRLYFSANDPAGNQAIYSTDGSTIFKQTEQVSTGTPNNFIVTTNFIFFFAYDSSAHSKLFSLSKDNVVRQLSDCVSGANDYFNYDPNNLAELGSYIYFAGYTSTAGNYTVYRTNGTNLQRILDTGYGDDAAHTAPVKVGNYILFTAYGFSGGGYINLYETDGTSIIQIEELFGGDDAALSLLGVRGGKLFFSAFSDALTDFGTCPGCKKDLFYTDGDTMNVMFASNVYQSAYNISGFINDAASASVYSANNEVFIYGTDSFGEQVLYKFDGTLSLQQIHVTGSGSTVDPATLTYWNGKYYLSGNYNGSYTTLYEVTANGLDVLHNDSSGWGVYSLSVLNGKLHFAGDDGSGHAKLFMYDGIYLTKLTDFDNTMTDFDNGGNCDTSTFRYFNNAIWADVLVDSNTCYTKLSRICAVDGAGNCVY